MDNLEQLLESLRDAFAAIFFWIGLVTDPGLFTLSILGMIVAAVIVTPPTKTVSGYLGGRLYGLNDRRSLRVDFGMTTRGEFSLIIASLALSGSDSGMAAETAQTIYAFTVGYILVMFFLYLPLTHDRPSDSTVILRHGASGNYVCGLNALFTLR